MNVQSSNQETGRYADTCTYMQEHRKCTLRVQGEMKEDTSSTVSLAMPHVKVMRLQAQSPIRTPRPAEDIIG